VFSVGGPPGVRTRVGPAQGTSREFLFWNSYALFLSKKNRVSVFKEIKKFKGAVDVFSPFDQKKLFLSVIANEIINFFLVEGLLYLAFSFRFYIKNCYLSHNGDEASYLGFKEKKKNYLPSTKNLYVLPEYAFVSSRQYSCKLSNAFGPESPLFSKKSLRLSYLFYLSWLVA
jgi:hypothetical protein